MDGERSGPGLAFSGCFDHPTDRHMSAKQQINLVMVVSGGQTGADRAALVWAIEQGIPQGGGAPEGPLVQTGARPPDRAEELRERKWLA